MVGTRGKADARTCHDHEHAPDLSDRRPADSGWAVETHGLTKRFGDNVAVNGVDLRIPRGCAFGYLGPERRGQDDADPGAARA